jgi:AI-2 transport protein TqsA
MSEQKDTAALINVALSLLIVTLTWYLLQQLSSLLRPLMLAVFLAYIILPIHHKLHKIRGPVAIVVRAGLSIGVLYVLTLWIYTSVVDLSEELPRLSTRAREVYDGVNRFFTEHLSWLTYRTEAGAAGGQENQRLGSIANALVNAATESLSEALVVGFYLLFLLLEVHRFPQRVRSGFTGERAAQILEVAGRVNGAIANYLKAKVQASLILAMPVTLVLWASGIKFAIMWGVLTFMCNFVPYLGSIVAVTLPLAFAFLDPDLYPGARPFLAAAGVLTTHLVVTYLVEPMITSRAVGLSPLVILFSLAFWGHCWGFIGMFLAVPLTVMVKIVLENMPFTRPFAELLGDRLTAEP